MKEIVIISPFAPVEKEAYFINCFFKLGLDYYFVRHPTATPRQLTEIQRGVAEPYRNRLIFHYTNRYLNPERVHLHESLRNELKEGWVRSMVGKGIFVSTSVHDPFSLRYLPDYYHFAFISPLFNSISKPGYQAEDKDIWNAPVYKGNVKLMALGGIQYDNLHLPLSHHFDGVALLGVVCNTPNPIAAFERIMHKFRNFR